jgi:MinD superfamily P-loop ATPase
MAEILIISGKGGTGKTSLSAAFAHMAQAAIVCDLDVDTPNLHLLLKPRIQQQTEFIAGHQAIIDNAICDGCGQCEQLCAFNAIDGQDGQFSVDTIRCEGCRVCVTFCPRQAIAFEAKRCGHWYLSQTRFGPMVHARLLPGEENSGRLVTLLRQQARRLAQLKGIELILSDGAPGIGCPVISALSGTDLAVVVTEPTPSGMHDLQRVLDLCRHFKVPAAVIINKADLLLQKTRQIIAWLKAHDHPLIATIPYDLALTRAMIAGKVITEESPSQATRPICEAWQTIQQMLNAELKTVTKPSRV